MCPSIFHSNLRSPGTLLYINMIALGMATEYRKYNIAVNCLWTKTAINTSAISMLGGFVTPEQCRKPEIVSDAANIILSKKSSECTGNFFIDEYLLHESGERDFDKYAVKPGSKLFQDLYLD